MLTDITDAEDRAALTQGAVVAATAAAASSGVTIRVLDGIDELRQSYELYEEIWRFQAQGAPVTVEVLRALSKAGSYIAGAFDGEEMVGACVGFFAPPGQRSLHSHVAGVSSRVRGRSVGFALKLHQRAWALEQGVTEISWTFDPLIGRNAYFNLTKLAATPVEYLTNFYGTSSDDLNGADDTDRLLVSWRLDDPQVVAACAGDVPAIDLARARAAGAVAGLDVTPGGTPLVHETDAATTVLVAVPPDIEGLRRTDPAGAAAWRRALREVLGGLLGQGARIRGFDRSDCYLIDTGTDTGELA